MRTRYLWTATFDWDGCATSDGVCNQLWTLTDEKRFDLAVEQARRYLAEMGDPYTKELTSVAFERLVVD